VGDDPLAQGTNLLINATSLTTQTTVVSLAGRSAFLDGDNGDVGWTVNFDPSVTAAIGDGTTYYFAFLVYVNQLRQPVRVYIKSAEILFGNDNITSNGEGDWLVQENGADTGANFTTTEGASPAPPTVQLFLYEITNNAAGDETVNVWVDPADASNLGTPNATAAFEIGAPATLALRTNGAISFINDDEFRLSTTAAESVLVELSTFSIE
jgi:hypothetical protein